MTCRTSESGFKANGFAVSARCGAWRESVFCIGVFMYMFMTVDLSARHGDQLTTRCVTTRSVTVLGEQDLLKHRRARESSGQSQRGQVAGDRARAR